MTTYDYDSEIIRVKPRVQRHNRQFIYDTQTRNLSFLQTAADLKLLGVKNNKFFLILFNPDLQGVDPHSPFLTEEQQMAILTECIANPWYFLREVVRIPDQGGTGIPYQLHRANLAMTYLFLLNIDNYTTIPRQKGKTQSAIAQLLWAFNFGTTNSEVMFLNKQLADANNNLHRLKQQRDLLPHYLRMETAYDLESGKIIKGNDNVQSLYNPNTKNKIVTKPSATSREKADNLGRGNTQPIQFLDEVEFTPFIKTIMQASGPAFKTASANAARNGAPYCRVLISTPGDLDSQAGEDASEILATTCSWSEKMYDMTPTEIRNYVKTNAPDSGIVYVEYNYKQLGEGDEWLNEMARLLFNDKIKIRREIHLHRIHGSNMSPFEAEDLQAISEMKKAPIREEIIMGVYKFDIYEELHPGKIYITGVDCSQGVGQDNNAMTVLDPDTLKPVAEFKSPYISLPDFKRLIIHIVTNYIPRTILAIERNMTGSAVIDDLLEHPQIRRNIYFEKVSDIHKLIDEHLDDKGFLARQAMKRKFNGVHTGPKSRELMMKILEMHVHEMKDTFVTKNVTGDLLNLVKNKRGKIEAASGRHDDSIMSYLIALYVYYHGKNLLHFGYVKGANEIIAGIQKGLYNPDMEIPEEYKEFFTPIKEQESVYDDYQRKIDEARQRARIIDQQLGVTRGGVVANHEATPYDYAPQTTSIPMSFFDELND